MILYTHHVIVLVLVLLGTTVFKKTITLRRFKSDPDEIWQDCFQRNNASIDGSRIFEVTGSNSSHDVISRPTPLADAAASAGCPLAHPARVTSVPDPVLVVYI